MSAALHLYIHIPFCERVCAYCDFARVAGRRELHAPYITVVIQELQRTVPLLATREIATLYIGGGTPSCLPPHELARLLAAVRRQCRVAPGAEVTVECNPHHVTEQWARALMAEGVNRFSVGVQSLNDGELRILRRLHTADDARRAFRVLRACGCENISVDLMYGLPDQTKATWRAAITEVTEEWRPEHISLYALHLERGTPLYRMRHAAGARHAWPDDEHTMNWYWHAVDTMCARGYEQYELSNCARPGCASRHNAAYWDTHKEYLGLGAAAHSYCTLQPWAAPRRFRTVRDVRTYCARVTAGQRWRMCSRVLPLHARLGEERYLGLRRTNGVVPRPDHRKEFGAVIARQIDSGLVRSLPDGAIALTRRGMEIANTVMAEYV